MLNLASTDPRFNMRWDHRDMISGIDLGGGGQAYYQYDAGKQRTRKYLEREVANPDGTKRWVKDWERIYLGGYELYRRYNGNGTARIEEIESHHLFEGEQRVLLVDDVISTDRTHADGTPFKTGPIFRYQYSNHLGSACLELDHEAEIISYEEYHPYGTSAYRAMKSGIEAPPKRYRYTGMERDEESGMNYHAARYYATWLGRWGRADPKGLAAGINFYNFCKNNPVANVDRSGLQPEDRSFKYGNYTIRVAPNEVMCPTSGNCFNVPPPPLAREEPPPRDANSNQQEHEALLAKYPWPQLKNPISLEPLDERIKDLPSPSSGLENWTKHDGYWWLKGVHDRWYQTRTSDQTRFPLDAPLKQTPLNEGLLRGLLEQSPSGGEEGAKPRKLLDMGFDSLPKFLKSYTEAWQLALHPSEQGYASYFGAQVGAFSLAPAINPTGDVSLNSQKTFLGRHLDSNEGLIRQSKFGSVLMYEPGPSIGFTFFRRGTLLVKDQLDDTTISAGVSISSERVPYITGGGKLPFTGPSEGPYVGLRFSQTW